MFYESPISDTQLSFSKEDEYIAVLDPLQADKWMRQVPLFNQTQDIIELVLLMVDLMPSMEQASGFDSYQANAAMRDIGFFLGSLKRHHVEPVNVIPQLEEKLNLLASKTNLPPRDTLLHYTVWNPIGLRRRTYTGTQDEKHLIESVVIAMDPLVQSIYLLQQLHQTSLQSAEFSAICKKIYVLFEKVIEGIVLARRQVSPAYFANELRFYFDPITLNEREYLGPGAVEMPMFVFDHLLWSSDCLDAEYQVFKETYVPYIHPNIRLVYRQFSNTDSLVTKACQLATSSGFHPIVVDSLKALASCCRLLKSFRMPHKKVAEEAYAHTKQPKLVEQEAAPSQQRSHGSGGYSTDILSHILSLTNDKISLLDSCLVAYQSRASSC